MGHNTTVMRALVFVLAFAALAACTGRTPPAGLPRSSGGNVVDAGNGGIVDSGVGVDAGPNTSDYLPCQSLNECPAQTVRCTIERAGICNPPCANDGTCPSIEGKAGICVGDGTVEWCVLSCGEDLDCPTGFVCSGGGTCVNG